MTEETAPGPSGRGSGADRENGTEQGAGGGYDTDRTRLWHAVLAHRERLLRISRTRTPTAQDAEDCVQEAMLRCMEFQNLDESRLGPFLTTVTLRLCADRHRERSNEDRLRHRLGFRDRDTPGPEDDICDRSEAAWLAAQFGELTPRQQEIIRARESGLSCAEVASRFRMSYVSVESSLSRARTRFRDALAKTMGVLSPSAWRWTTALEAATVGAVAIGALVSTPGATAALPAVAPPAPTVVFVDRAADRAPLPVAAPAKVPVVSRLETAAPRVRAAVEVKKPKPEPIVTVPGTGWNLVTEDPNEPDPSTPEQVMQCIQYGITTTLPIRCNRPPKN